MKLDDAKRVLEDRGMEVYGTDNNNYTIRCKGRQVGRLVPIGISGFEYQLKINLVKLEEAQKTLDQ